jgi:hypothetical protein
MNRAGNRKPSGDTRYKRLRIQRIEGKFNAGAIFLGGPRSLPEHSRIRSYGPLL